MQRPKKTKKNLQPSFKKEKKRQKAMIRTVTDAIFTPIYMVQSLHSTNYANFIIFY